jgi:hypothetical protein
MKTKRSESRAVLHESSSFLLTLHSSLCEGIQLPSVHCWSSSVGRDFLPQTGSTQSRLADKQIFHALGIERVGIQFGPNQFTLPLLINSTIGAQLIRHVVKLSVYFLNFRKYQERSAG